MIDDHDGQFDIIPVTEGVHSDLGWYEAVCTVCDDRSGNNAEPFTDDWVETHTCATVDMVNHPPHYKGTEGISFDCITVVRDLSFDVGNAVKYLWRTEMKNGIEDIEKARWYLLDAVKWNDPFYVGHTPMQFSARCATLVRAQTDPLRRKFFQALRAQSARWMLDAVDDMLTSFA